MFKAPCIKRNPIKKEQALGDTFCLQTENLKKSRIFTMVSPKSKASLFILFPNILNKKLN